jgi:HAD superfamily hydrolase (TIGR01549 family)
MTLAAMVFDVDGTLVDSNGLHAEAWERTFRDHGMQISAARVLPLIGKGGDKLVPSLLGDDLDEELFATLRKGTPVHFAALAQARGISVLEGARAIFPALRERGLRLALATSGKRKDFENVVRASGFDPRPLVDEVVTGDDVEGSKPDPDLVARAAEVLGLRPGACAMVGDTPYDAEAARRAGVLPIGVLTGVHGEAALRGAGAAHVYRDLVALAQDLDAILGNR